MTAPTPNQMPGATPPEPQPADEATPAAPAAADPALTQFESEKPPPWGSDDDFKPDKAWKLIQNLRSENAEFKAKAQPVLDEHERLRRASQTELEQAREDINAISTGRDTWRAQAVRAEAKALAATRQFIDADVAVQLLGDLTGYADDNGIDNQKLSAQLDQLAADKPFLVAQPPPQGFTPNRGQGQSGTGRIPLDAQIQAAQERGDLMASIALKQQKKYLQ